MDISQKVIFGAFAEKSKAFVFKIRPKDWKDKFLQLVGLQPKERTLYVSPICLGARSLCSTYINKLSFDKYSNNTVFRAGTELAEHESKNLIMFLATVLWNKKSTPPSWLIDCIEQMNQDDLDQVIEFAFESLNTQAFLNSIISMTGVSLQTDEIIAPEKESQESTK